VGVGNFVIISLRSGVKQGRNVSPSVAMFVVEETPRHSGRTGRVLLLWRVDCRNDTANKEDSLEVNKN
jgi:hypothetical protein